LATLSTESKETCDALRLEIEVAKVSAADAISKFAALETANAIVAAEASEATQKHAELVELAASAESRVQNVVAQLENEQKEVDRLEKQAEEAKARFARRPGSGTTARSLVKSKGSPQRPISSKSRSRTTCPRRTPARLRVGW
jgi:chromosome segregation ATPase